VRQLLAEAPEEYVRWAPDRPRETIRRVEIELDDGDIITIEAVTYFGVHEGRADHDDGPAGDVDPDQPCATLWRHDLLLH
jgi:hypothetical protein